jgi:hypothetical protein
VSRPRFIPGFSMRSSSSSRRRDRAGDSGQRGVAAQGYGSVGVRVSLGQRRAMGKDIVRA